MLTSPAGPAVERLWDQLGIHSQRRGAAVGLGLPISLLSCGLWHPPVAVCHLSAVPQALRPWFGREPGLGLPGTPPTCPRAVVVGEDPAALRSIGVGSVGVSRSVPAAVSLLHGVTFPGAPCGRHRWRCGAGRFLSAAF